MIRHTLATTVTAISLAFAGTQAMAQTDHANMMSIADIATSLEADGYTHIDSIDRDDGHYDVDATDPSGMRVDLEVDARTGDILRSERDD